MIGKAVSFRLPRNQVELFGRVVGYEHDDWYGRFLLVLILNQGDFGPSQVTICVRIGDVTGIEE